MINTLSNFSLHLFFYSQKFFFFPLIISIFLFGCGSSGSSNNSEILSSGIGSMSTGNAYPNSISGNPSYYVLVSDDLILGARLIGVKNITDAYKISRETSVCEGFTDLGRGVYSLNNCSDKPSRIIAVGGFIDLNGNGKFDSDEPTQFSSLEVDTTVLMDENFTITPINTLAAADYTINRGTLAAKLGFANRVEAYRATEGNQAMNRLVNAVLSAANNSGFNMHVFCADLAARIVDSNSIGIAALQEAIHNLIQAPESQIAYGDAKLQSFWNDSRVQAVINGTDVMSAMLAKKIPNGRLRISGLVTTYPTGSNIVNGAAVSVYVNGSKIGEGASNKYGQYSIEVNELAIPKDAILSLKAETEKLTLTSSVATNTLLRKRVNGQISANQIEVLVLSNYTTMIDAYIKSPIKAPCEVDQYYRIQTKECLPLENPTWGFQGFIIPSENIYPLIECSQSALQNLINSVPKEGGRIVMPSCTINTINGIKIPDNIILEGMGIGKTILSNTVTTTSPGSAVNLLGENIIIKNFTLNGNGTTLNGIDNYVAKGNSLIEFIEAKNFKRDQGSAISYLTKNTLENSRVTVRYNKTSNALHGIDAKVWTLAKMLIYSNESFENANYGLDLSTNDSIEVAGNYLHNNEVAGAKSPAANNIIFHTNDINLNGSASIGAGLVYMSTNPTATIIVKNNDISNNLGPAYACWNAKFNRLILINNNVKDSNDSNGYNITGSGADSIEVTGDHGKIWSNGAIVYH